MFLLRLFWAATGLLALALVIGAFAVLGWQQWYWYRHGIWPQIHLVHLFQWARVNPSLAGRFGVRESLQWPLWVCLIGPGIILGWIAAKLGALKRRDERRRAAVPPQRRDAA